MHAFSAGGGLMRDQSTLCPLSLRHCEKSLTNPAKCLENSCINDIVRTLCVLCMALHVTCVLCMALHVTCVRYMTLHVTCVRYMSLHVTCVLCMTLHVTCVLLSCVFRGITNNKATHDIRATTRPTVSKMTNIDTATCVRVIIRMR